MALRDWHGWHLGLLWALGIGIAWLVSRLGVAAVGRERVDLPPADTAIDLAMIPADGAAVSGGGAPLWTTAVIILILTILLVVTVRWVRGQILDQ